MSGTGEHVWKIDGFLHFLMPTMNVGQESYADVFLGFNCTIKLLLKFFAFF